MLETMRATVPMQRLGAADECAGTFLYLASDALSGYVTGQIARGQRRAVDAVAIDFKGVRGSPDDGTTTSHLLHRACGDVLKAHWGRRYNLGLSGWRIHAPALSPLGGRPDREHARAGDGRPQTTGVPMASIEFTAFPRDGEGRGASRRLRHAGQGAWHRLRRQRTRRRRSSSTTTRSSTRCKAEAFHASILTMKLDGAGAQGAAARRADASVQPQVLHVDFQRIDENRKIHMKVPLHFVNERCRRR